MTRMGNLIWETEPEGNPKGTVTRNVDETQKFKDTKHVTNASAQKENCLKIR